MHFNVIISLHFTLMLLIGPIEAYRSQRRRKSLATSNSRALNSLKIGNRLVPVKSVLSANSYDDLIAKRNHSIRFWHGTLANRVFPLMKALKRSYGQDVSLKLMPTDILLFKYHVFPLVGEHTTSRFAFGPFSSERYRQTRFLKPPDPSDKRQLSSWNYANENYFGQGSKFSYNADRIPEIIERFISSLSKKEYNENSLYQFVSWISEIRLLDKKTTMKHLKEAGITPTFMDGKIPLWKAAFQCLDEVLHFQRVTQQQFLDYSKLTQYFETESEKFASIDRLLEHLLRQISYGSEKIKQDIHEMQRSHQKELDRLLQGFRYIVDPASPTPQITSDEKIDVFGPNVPILFSSKDMSVSIVHHDREIFTENSMPEIGKELDTIVCRRKDLEWVTRNLQQLGARLQTLNFVILNE